MNLNRRAPTLATSSVLAVAAVAFAIVIFIVDTITPLEGAVAVLYVIVVVIAANFFQRRGILLVAISCLALTVLSYAVTHGFQTTSALLRFFVSIAAIGITTVLALRVREKERELQLTIDTIPTLAWHTRPDGFAEYLNRRWLDYTGLSLEQGRGWNWQVAVHPDDLPGLSEQWREILAAGKRAETEARLRRADGEYRWFLFRCEPLYDEQGKVSRWYGTNTDIEDIKRAEEALRRSEAYLTEAQRLSRTGTFGWKVASKEIVWSEETYRIFDYDRAVKPVLGLVLQRAHPDDIEMVEDLIARVEQGARYVELTHRLLMPSGAIKHVRVLVHAIDTEGELEYAGAVMDITSSRQAEEAVQTAQAELAHVTRVTTLGELAASIAHDVSQPLTGIVTNGAAGLRWLGQQPLPVDEVRNTLAAMIDDAKRASDVIQRIRALSKKTDFEKTQLDMNDVIHDVARLVQREVLSQGASLQLELAPALPPVLGDRVQLQQVIINLVINGIQAMQSVTGRSRDLCIRSRAYEADRILVAVEDCGMGIDPEHADRVFNAFFTTKPDGMGMGLSICRSIIEAHGGRVWASGHAGPGATFQFTLPTDGATARG